MGGTLVFDMADAVEDFLQPTEFLTRTTTSANFESTETDGAPELLDAVVYPEDPKRLNIDNIDYSLEYLGVITFQRLRAGKTNDPLTNSTTLQIVKRNTTLYKIIRSKAFGDYGFYFSVAEEIKT